MWRNLRKLYNQPLNFISQVLLDVEDLDLWFNVNEFAKIYDINGHKVKCVFMNATHKFRNSKLNAGDLIMTADATLYLKGSDVSDLRAEQTLRINGKLYTIIDVANLQNAIWRVSLKVAV